MYKQSVQYGYRHLRPIHDWINGEHLHLYKNNLGLISGLGLMVGIWIVYELCSRKKIKTRVRKFYIYVYNYSGNCQYPLDHFIYTNWHHLKTQRLIWPISQTHHHLSGTLHPPINGWKGSYVDWHRNHT